MSNPVSYVNNVVNLATQMINLAYQMQQANEQSAADSTLITRYFQSPGARTDITATDVTNCLSAFTQIKFTFDSGAPTQKSFLFKMQP